MKTITFNSKYFKNSVRVYYIVKDNPNMTSQEIADKIKATIQNVEYILQQLRKDNYISVSVIRRGIPFPVRTISIVKEMIPFITS